MSLFMHIGLNTRREEDDRWGDQQYAHSLAKALQSLGHRVEFFYREEKPQISGRNDVVISLLGPHLDEPVPGVPNLLWIISPPNLAPVKILARYQMVFFASAWLASHYANLGVTTCYLPQATDTTIFNMQAHGDAPLLYDVTFVGEMAARAPKGIVLQAIKLGFDVKVWGDAWSKVVPAKFIGGTGLKPHEVAKVYARSRVVLNSHIFRMNKFGFMSNRSFDALACGAYVVSDSIQDFAAPELQGLFQVNSRQVLADTLKRLISDTSSPQERGERSAQVSLEYSFQARAQTLADYALQQLEMNNNAEPAFRILPPKKVAGDLKSIEISDVPHATDANDLPPGARLDALLSDYSLNVTLVLSDPSTTPAGLSTLDAMRRSAAAILRISGVLARRRLVSRLTVIPPSAEDRCGLIHPGMADLRIAQEVAMSPISGEAISRLEEVSTRARRLLDFQAEEEHPLGKVSGVLGLERTQLRIANNKPLYSHQPTGYSRDPQKRHLVLWPRNNPLNCNRPIGIFIHLFYPELTKMFKTRIKSINAPYKVYISTDTAAKAAQIKEHFPTATVKVLPNRGRDIFGKLYGFPEAYRNHNIVLHLHGKKSPHEEKLDQWLDHCLSCLLPNRGEVSRILSLFQSAPTLGIVAPLTFTPIQGATHWGDNKDIAREIMHRMELLNPLPSNAELAFPASSMFWARTKAIQPLLDLPLREEHFPVEDGHVDSSLAHAIERLYGVVCYTTGHKLIRVAPAGNVTHKTHQISTGTNREFQDALEQGALG